MKCTQCNAEMPNDAVFCTNCGAKLEQQSPQPQMDAGAQTAGAAQPMAGNTQSGNKLPFSKKQMGIIGGVAAAVVVVIIIAAALIANRKTTLNLWDYAEVRFSGYNGYGEASLHWDRDKLFKAAIKGMKLKSKDKDDLWDAYKDNDSEEFSDILDDNDYDVDDFNDLFNDLFDKSKVSKTSDLKNKDQLTVKFRFDNDDAKEFGLKFKAEDKKVEVKDLREIEKINPFDYVDVSFEGTSPEVRVNVVAKDDAPEVMDAVRFEDGVEGYAKAGDKIKVTTESNYSEEELRSTYGCQLTETEKEYTVENVDDYLFSNTDLEANAIFAEIKTQTETALKEDFANDSSIAASGMTYVGYYFLTQKLTDTDTYYGSYSDYNKLYVVYSAKIKSKDSYNKFKATTVYFPVLFSNTVKKADGTFELNSYNSYRVEGGISLGYHWMDGYTSEADMKNALVVGQGTSYDCATGGSLK